jgi:4-hydroxythreonine-4-phosphate dehydrogenase
MNVLDGLWMSRVTSHVALRVALEQLDGARIEQALALADATMRGAGIAQPRIAVAALNPHAGENGLFGREEIDMIAPAVARAAARGIRCSGPFAADTVFLKAFAGEYDGVLSMYHDQGQIATKLKGFNRGVTVTAGLASVFTTPAHGTAFDIVGQGRADTGALEQAVRLGARLATARH